MYVEDEDECTKGEWRRLHGWLGPYPAAARFKAIGCATSVSSSARALALGTLQKRTASTPNPQPRPDSSPQHSAGLCPRPRPLILTTAHTHTRHAAMADLAPEKAQSASAPASALNSGDNSRAPTPSNAAAEKAPDDSSKFKTFLGILRR